MFLEYIETLVPVLIIESIAVTNALWLVMPTTSQTTRALHKAGYSIPELCDTLTDSSVASQSQKQNVRLLFAKNCESKPCLFPLN
jgi:hypothetical protein